MTSSHMESFGDLLRAYRQEAGLTQEELAERANLSARAISELERGARQYPYRATIQLLARALALSDPQSAAFQQAGRRPAATKLTGRGSASSTASAAPRRAEPQHNLPAQLTSFIGRASEVAQIQALLLSPAVRLLTLTGPPGTGKTRLSLAVAATLLADFPGGVFFVELAPVGAPQLVAPAIAASLGVKESAGRSFVGGELQRFLQDRPMLLVLDNFEQVLGAAPLVVELLQAGLRLKVLVTSRAALHLRAEKEYAVPPLALPDPGRRPPLHTLTHYEAVQLFVERARDTQADFRLTEDNALAVAQITQRLDGLPLAIELAAARIRIFSPQGLLSRLEHSLKMLTGGDQDLPARQQTLRAAVDWSHDLLSEPEKALFRRLAVFAGGCTLEAIAAVCDAGPKAPISALDGLESLVGKSLVQQREGRAHERRFWLLELIREYGREKLAQSGESEELSRKHAVYFVQLAEQAEPSLWVQGLAESVKPLEDEYENLRVALAWTLGDRAAAAQGQRQLGLRLCAALWAFWDCKGYYGEGRRWLAVALAPEITSAISAQDAGGQVALARALMGAGLLAMNQAELTTAGPLIEAGLRLSRRLADRRGILVGLYVAGDRAARQGDHRAARTCYEEALPITRELDATLWTAFIQMNLGALVLLEGDPARARALTEESLAINRQLGSQSQTAWALIYLGEVAYVQEELAEARRLFEESLAMHREDATSFGEALALRGLASVALAQDELDQAESACAEGLVLCRELGDGRSIAHCFAILAGIAARGAAGGRRAATLVGATEALLERTGTTLWLMQHKMYTHAALAARERLGDAEFEAARGAGRALTTEQAVAYALERPGRRAGVPEHAS